MTLFVDTSVWSFALRRDASASEPEVHALKDALLGRDVIDTTGLVLQELLQGPRGQEPARKSSSASPLPSDSGTSH